MADWKDRTQPEIRFISPSGQQHAAFWKGDPRTLEKKVGIFEYPKIKGAVTQDLDVGGDRYTLSFYFAGAYHDILAEDFYQACRERGRWTVYHPTKGAKVLQLIRITEEIQPIESANMTAFTSEWVEPMDGEAKSWLSGAEASETINVQSDIVQSDAAEEFEDTVDITDPDALATFINSAKTAATQVKAQMAAAAAFVDNTLAPLTETVAEVNAQIESVHRGITSSLNSGFLSVMSLAGQLQAAVTLPGLTFRSISARFNGYLSIFGRSIGGGKQTQHILKMLAPTLPTKAHINKAAVQQLVGTSCLVGLAQTIAGDASTPVTFTSREQAMEYVDAMTAAFSAIVDELDASQELYANSPIEARFFSQSKSFNSCALLTAQVINLLLRQSFDLAAAKRFTLKKPRTPLEIAITERMDLDLFISANNLKGNEILLLPAGREVVVYL